MVVVLLAPLAHKQQQVAQHRDADQGQQNPSGGGGENGHGGGLQSPL